MTKTKKVEDLSFEDSMQELENIVSAMEKGDMPLEDALTNFERGVQLANNSQQKLKQAEQKVEILLKQNEQEELSPFDESDLN
ncbi:exodeoxyribonuclease VII small subunit [Alteromonadaceae bacterium M269]|nr:exodeoxyribonuclease VII small subunit [Alteromonadaceae bacterium M269]